MIGPQGRRLVRRLRPAGAALLRGLRRSWAALLLFAGFVLLGSGVLVRGSRLGAVLLPGAALLLLLHKLNEQLGLAPGPRQPGGHREPRLRLELEAGAALVLGTFAALQALGGARSPLHPLVYALVAFLASQHQVKVAVALCGLVIVGEALLLFGDGLLRAAPGLLLLRGAFVGLFAVLHLLLVRGGHSFRQRQWARQLAMEVARLRREAAEFRLLGTHEPQRGATREDGRAEAEELLARGAVVLVHQSLRAQVTLLRHALRLRTCALYWLDGEHDRLRLKEGISDGPPLRAEVPADAGALGTVVKSRAPLRLLGPKPGHLPYYDAAAAELAAAAFLGVPVLEGDRLVGVLFGDRAEEGGAEPAFSAQEEELAAAAAEQVLRGLQSERVFTQVERSRYELERLYHASERLNRALTPEQVHATAFAAAAEICAIDLGALTTFDAAQRRHAVAAAEGEAALGAPLVGLSFPDNAGLVAMAVKNRHLLPQDGALRPERSPVFDDKVRLHGFESLLVLPLLCGGEVLGTLVLGARRPHVFGKKQRDMLAVLANQVAVALENARMYKAMEAMATTDGLTGLTNRRAFNERFEEMLRRAERQGKSLTLVLTDIDHFKRINDTYGHPVGDVVLKRVAQVVLSCLRKIDMAARYGGEEFALVLEMTERDGGRQLAERVRREVQSLAFHSDKGPFQCTLSLGMATFPLDGHDAKTLIAHADQALYYAKRNGRNQAVSFEDLRSAPQRAVG